MARYDDAAIQKCFRLYVKHNGQNHAQIEKEMRKVYPSWQRQYLYTRGTGKNLKIGWIEQYNWEKGLALENSKRPTAALNSAERLVNEIEEIRQLVFESLKAQGGKDKDLLQAHRDYSRLSIDALTKVEAARDTLGAWVNFWERLLEWVVDLDVKTGKALIKLGEELIARAEREFGETEEMVNGTTATDTKALAGTQA